MALKELAADYYAAAELLRKRLKELRKLKKESTDADERWHIEMRIKALTPLLTETREVADLLEHYYEPGYWRSRKYTLNVASGKQKSGVSSADYTGNDDGTPAEYIHSVLFRKEEYGGDRKRKKRKDKHCIEDLGACGESR